MRSPRTIASSVANGAPGAVSSASTSAQRSTISARAARSMLGADFPTGGPLPRPVPRTLVARYRGGPAPLNPESEPEYDFAVPVDPQTLTARQFARRERIIRAGQTLLQERALDQIQVRDVAARADVALSTVYRYFASKEHLFAAVFLAWHSTMRS